MIDLTPLEVRKKKGDFARVMRGYDTAQVEDFLDLVAERLDAVVRENVTSRERLARLEAQVAEFRERERALTEALVTAQEVREEVRRQATKDSELVLREAEADAERIRMEAMRSREWEEESLRRLRARRTLLVESYRRFLERELAELAVVEESLELGPPPMAGAGGRRRKPVVTQAAQAPAATGTPLAAPADGPHGVSEEGGAESRETGREEGGEPHPEKGGELRREDGAELRREQGRETEDDLDGLLSSLLKEKE
jgi:cell division initiation protein